MGPRVRRFRARCSDPGDGALVDLYRDRSVAPLVDARRRLRAVLDVIANIGRSGFTVSRGLELTRQWRSVVAGGPQGTVTAEALARVAGLGLLTWRFLLLFCVTGWTSFCRVLFGIERRRLFLGGRLGSWRTL